MNKNRIEALTDGVLAIVITIMVLEMKAPHGHEAEELWRVLPAFLAYVLSFVYVAIFWLAHHHMMLLVKRVTSGILWANIYFLFALSLIPFGASWLAESHGEGVPVALYGVILLQASLSSLWLQKRIKGYLGPSHVFTRALSPDFRGLIPPIAYGVGSVVALWWPEVAIDAFVVSALCLMVPDRRLEQALVLQLKQEGMGNDA